VRCFILVVSTYTSAYYFHRDCSVYEKCIRDRRRERNVNKRSMPLNSTVQLRYSSHMTEYSIQAYALTSVKISEADRSSAYSTRVHRLAVACMPATPLSSAEKEQEPRVSVIMPAHYKHVVRAFLKGNKLFQRLTITADAQNVSSCLYTSILNI
jgi:hypothetical protein